MKVRLTTLCENTAGKPGLKAEWGLSILIEVDRFKVLFDTGTSTVVTHNARVLGLDLSQIDKIVLSHGHDDHTGGLADVLQVTGSKEIFAHPDIWSHKYTKRPHQDQAAYIGLRFQREALVGMGAQFAYSQKPVQISDNIFTTGEVEMTTGYEEIESNLLVKEKGILGPDPLADDLSLVIKTPKGLVVVLGCAHRGMINHLRQAQKITGESKIHTVVGGTHLIYASDERIEKTIAELKQWGVQKIGVSHCTGFKATLRLAQAFKDIFFLNNAGTQCDFSG